MRDLPYESRLPDAGLADDGHHLAVAGLRASQRRAQLLQLSLASHEAREASRGRGMKSRALRTRRHDRVDFHRRVQALDGDRPERLDFDVTFREPQRFAGDQNRAGIGELLHPRGQMRGLPDRRVVHVEVAADGPHDDVAGIEPDANLDLEAMGAAHLVRVATKRRLHVEGRVAGAHRVVLVSQRGAEQRHDPVAHHLIDRAFVAVDGLHHVLEHGIENPTRFLGVALGQELHRALQIGEQHRHLLALAFQGVLGDENFFGEVLGRVDLGRREFRRRAGLRERRPAIATEFLRGCAGCPARGAYGHQAGSAFAAELHGGRVLVLAPRTLHAAASRHQAS